MTVGNTWPERQLAKALLMDAAAGRDEQLEAEASLVLAQAHVLESQLVRAHQYAARALRLFLRLSNAAAQAEALSILSYSASGLGMDAKAKDAAAQGVSLGEALSSPLVQATGLNYLGVASFWAGDFNTADNVLEASVWLAEDVSSKAASFQPRVNCGFSEVLRVQEREITSGASGDLSKLNRLNSQTRKMQGRGYTEMLCQGGGNVARLLLEFTSLFCSRRSGFPSDAIQHFQACIEQSRHSPTQVGFRRLLGGQDWNMLSCRRMLLRPLCRRTPWARLLGLVGTFICTAWLRRWRHSCERPWGSLRGFPIRTRCRRSMRPLKDVTLNLHVCKGPV